jgi:hypothetical protein
MLAVMMFTGCGAAQTPDVPLDDILTAIKNAYGDDYMPNGEIPAELLEAEFGLTPDMYDDVRGEMAMITMFNDRVVLVKAKNGKADDVEKALTNARDLKIADTLQYPMNVPKTNAAKVVRQGNYIAFLMLGKNNDNMDDVSDESAKAFAEEQVQIGVHAFENSLK